jgi:hypothetical protein
MIRMALTLLITITPSLEASASEPRRGMLQPLRDAQAPRR